MVRSVIQFEKIIWAYYKKHGRRLDWRKTRDPYKIFISEVMLQQTQVPRVVTKYPEFIRKFPDFKALARASNADVLKVWQGMGYNRRALFLKRAAEEVMRNYNGRLPDDPEQLVKLPGIGPATAASICTFAFNRPVIFIETNIRAVFIHEFFKNRRKVHDDELLPFIEKSLDRKNPREWYYALMDYGSMLKKSGNPSRKSKHHVKQSKFEGSDRQLRGKIIKLLVSRSYTESQLIKRIQSRKTRVLLLKLQQEGFITKKGKTYSVA